MVEMATPASTDRYAWIKVSAESSALPGKRLTVPQWYIHTPMPWD